MFLNLKVFDFLLICWISNCNLSYPSCSLHATHCWFQSKEDSHPFPHLLCSLILPLQQSPLVPYTTLCFSLWCTQFSYHLSPLNFPASASEFLTFESSCSVSDGLWFQGSQKLPAAIPYSSLQKTWAESFKHTSPPEIWGAAGTMLLALPGVSNSWEHGRERC